jgi:rSAM/selenodomain-associated transferase 2
MNISIIVPVLNEERSIHATLQSLIRLSPHEIIVVDGGSRDRTCAICAQFPIGFFTTEHGRAQQMNFGARHTSGDVLLFLHADTHLPRSAFNDVAAALSDPSCVGGRFDVELEGSHWMLKVIATLINYRSRATKIATGDQALFVRRAIFERIGGYDEIPLMEDIAFCRRLKRLGKVACLRSRVVTSARRWERDGVWRTILKMWTLKLGYLAGISPGHLKKFYADTR